MSWLLHRAGQQQPEGPYEESQILAMVQSGQLSDGFVCRQGTQQWVPLGQQPPFSSAMSGGSAAQKRRGGGTLVMSMPEGPQGPTAGDWQSQVGQPGGPPQAYAPPAAQHPAAHHPAAQHPSAHEYGASQNSPHGQAYGAPQQVNAAAGAGPAPYGGGGSNVAGTAPGAPPPGWGGPAAALPPTASVPRPEKKKSKLGLIIGAVVGVPVLIGVAAAAIMLFTGGGESRVSKFVPKDVLVFVEFPSSANALRDALGMDFLNPSKIDADKQLQNAVQGMTESFELDKGQSEKLVFSLDGLAFAMRKEAGREQVAVLVTFRDADAVKPWLESVRVTKEGKFGSSGERYLVARAKSAPDPTAPVAVKALGGLSMEKEGSEVLVWFESEKLLGMGSKDLLDDIDSVLTKGEGALAEDEAFEKADFGKDASLLGFVSPDILDDFKGDDERKFIQGYMDGIAPFTLDTAFIDAGVLTRAQGQMKGNRITADDALPSAVDLTLPGHLPLGTVAYVAVGSEHTDDGKTLKTRMLKQVRATDEGAANDLEKSLEQLEKGAGVSFERIIDAIGSEVAFGLVVDSDFKLDKEKPPTEQLDKVAGVLLFGVGQQDAANDVVKQARIKLFEEGPLKATHALKEQEQGFQGLPRDPKLPTVQVFFHGGKLMVGVGGKQVLSRALLALGGKESLAGDKAHEKAISSLSKQPRLLSWVDSGRFGNVVLEALPAPLRSEMESFEKELGVSHDVIQLQGDERVTAALALYAESEGDLWNYRLESLNAPAFGILGAVGGLAQGVSPAIPEPIDAIPPIPTVPGLFLPQTGVPQCDGFILVMFQCGQRTNNPQMSADATALETRLKGEFVDVARKAAGGNQCSQDLVQFMIKNPSCSGG